MEIASWPGRVKSGSTRTWSGGVRSWLLGSARGTIETVETVSKRVPRVKKVMSSLETELGARGGRESHDESNSRDIISIPFDVIIGFIIGIMQRSDISMAKTPLTLQGAIGESRRTDLEEVILGRPVPEGYLVFEDPVEWQKFETETGTMWKGAKKVNAFACWRQHQAWTGQFLGQRTPHFYSQGEEIKMDVPLSLQIAPTELVIGTLRGGGTALVEAIALTERRAEESATGGVEVEGPGAVPPTPPSPRGEGAGRDQQEEVTTQTTATTRAEWRPWN